MHIKAKYYAQILIEVELNSSNINEAEEDAERIAPKLLLHDLPYKSQLISVSMRTIPTDEEFLNNFGQLTDETYEKLVADPDAFLADCKNMR